MVETIPQDSTGITTNLNNNEYQIIFQTKAPSYNAPNGHILTIPSSSVKVGRGEDLGRGLTALLSSVQVGNGSLNTSQP
eukprot:748699-Hanusia_phi.AAC.4